MYTEIDTVKFFTHNREINTGSNITMCNTHSLSLSLSHTHTHTHTHTLYRLIGVKDHTAQLKYLEKKNALSFVFEGRKSSRLPKVLGKVVPDDDHTLTHQPTHHSITINHSVSCTSPHKTFHRSVLGQKLEHRRANHDGYL